MIAGKAKPAELRPTGDIACEGGATALRRDLFEMIERGQVSIALRLDGVAFLDSDGITALLACQREAVRRGGGIVIVDPSPGVERTLRLVRLGQVFPIVRSDANGER
jgi:anti-sigma B factor antagonist